MALVDHAPLEPEDDGSELAEVQVRLERHVHEFMVELMARTGFDASELVTWALGAYWRELEGIVLPPGREEKIEKVLAGSEADIASGRTSSNEVVFGRIAVKHGW